MGQRQVRFPVTIDQSKLIVLRTSHTATPIRTRLNEAATSNECIVSSEQKLYVDQDVVLESKAISAGDTIIFVCLKSNGAGGGTPEWVGRQPKAWRGGRAPVADFPGEFYDLGSNAMAHSEPRPTSSYQHPSPALSPPSEVKPWNQTDVRHCGADSHDTRNKGHVTHGCELSPF